MEIISARDVKAGDVVWMYGYRWHVTANVFDPYGNTGDQPRQIIHADALDSDNGLPVSYRNDMTFGMLCDAGVSKEV